jgi:hypothetical protein
MRIHVYVLYHWTVYTVPYNNAKSNQSSSAVRYRTYGTVRGNKNLQLPKFLTAHLCCVSFWQHRAAQLNKFGNTINILAVYGCVFEFVRTYIPSRFVLWI